MRTTKKRRPGRPKGSRNVKHVCNETLQQPESPSEDKHLLSKVCIVTTVDRVYYCEDVNQIGDFLSLCGKVKHRAGIFQLSDITSEDLAESLVISSVCIPLIHVRSIVKGYE